MGQDGYLNGVWDQVIIWYIGGGGLALMGNSGKRSINLEGLKGNPLKYGRVWMLILNL